MPPESDPKDLSRKSERHEYTIPFVGLRISRKTDVLAVSAFLLALASVLTQVYHYASGANVSIFAPDQIALVLREYPNGERYLNIVTRMAYANSGYFGYNAVVERESILFEMNGVEYKQKWQSVSRFLAGGEIEYINEARPIAVGAGSSVSREIHFVPYPEHCIGINKGCRRNHHYITGDDIFEYFKSLERPVTMKFTIQGWILNKKGAEEAICLIEDSGEIFRKLWEDGWAVPACSSEP